MGVILIGSRVLLSSSGGIPVRTAPIPPILLPTVAVSVPSAVIEGVANLVFTVTLSNIAVEDVTVDYATSNGTALAGTNYTATSGTLTIPVGDTTGTIIVPVLNPSGYHGTKQLTLTLSNANHALEALTITTAAALGTIIDDEANPSANGHDYFNELLAREDFWKGYSFRRVGVSGNDSGGLEADNSWVSYAPATDTDPHAQDAAKVIIPSFTSNVTGTITADIDASQTVIPVSSAPGAPHRTLKIDNEYMTYVSRDSVNLTYTVIRGAGGSTPAAHNSGTAFYQNTNNLPNQTRVDLNTTDGNTYFFTWDGYWTDSYLNIAPNPGTHKTFQFSNASDAISIEVRTSYNGTGAESGYSNATSVCGVNVRYYGITGGPADWSLASVNQAGPGVTDEDPLSPQTAFTIAPNEWVRFFIKWEQRASDYDYWTMWIATESRAAVKIHDNLALNKSAIGKFWLEFNTSTDTWGRTDLRDLVTYVRNFAALINPPADLTSLLVQPVGD